jgi:zinc D-Ala-D-Ala carboxypeptidase
VNDIQVSENFKLREFQCKGRNCCNGAVKLDSKLLAKLQAMRTEAGQPLVVNSGYRCPVHNRAIGGANQSQHLEGKAADIRVQNISMADQIKLVEKHFKGQGGIGYASSYTHVDTGPAREWQEGK